MSDGKRKGDKASQATPCEAAQRQNLQIKVYSDSTKVAMEILISLAYPGFGPNCGRVFSSGSLRRLWGRESIATHLVGHPGWQA